MEGRGTAAKEGKQRKCQIQDHATMRRSKRRKSMHLQTTKKMARREAKVQKSTKVQQIQKSNESPRLRKGFRSRRRDQAPGAIRGCIVAANLHSDRGDLKHVGPLRHLEQKEEVQNELQARGGSDLWLDHPQRSVPSEQNPRPGRVQKSLGLRRLSAVQEIGRRLKTAPLKTNLSQLLNPEKLKICILLLSTQGASVESYNLLSCRLQAAGPQQLQARQPLQ